MDCNSSVGMPKTIHLAVDWHHNESPPCGPPLSIAGKTETTNLLTTSGHSPEKRRIQPTRGVGRLKRSSAPILRNQLGRKESSGNIWGNWG